MLKKVMVFIFSGLLALNMCGCAALLVGAVGGAGTAVWLSGKLTQQFHCPYERTVNAAKTAMRSLKLEITKETREEKIAQLKSKNSDGKEIWIDIRKITEDSTKVDVRVGAVSPDKEAADKILKRIQSCL